jgi:hypothetical protein
MLAIPSSLRTEFKNYLRNKSIEYGMHGLYKKCLRFYLYFFHKHNHPNETEKKSPTVHKEIEACHVQHGSGALICGIH